MNNPTSPRTTLAHYLWVALRFLVFGVGGLVVLLGSALAFGLFLSGAKIPTLSPWLSLPLTFAAALLMLFGTGKWGQWFYLLIFLSIPFTLWMLSVVSGPGSGKLGIFLVIIAVPLGCCALIRTLEAAKARPPQPERTEKPPRDEY